MTKPTSHGKKKMPNILRMLAAKFGIAAAPPGVPKRKRQRKPRFMRKRRHQLKSKPRLTSRRVPRPKR